LYGSDAACWLLRILVDGQDGGLYNVGGARPVSHTNLAEMVAIRTTPKPQVIYKTKPTSGDRHNDFIPSLDRVVSTLGLKQAFELEAAVERAMIWHAVSRNLMRRLNLKTFIADSVFIRDSFSCTVACQSA
jgi:dTDP-glucose 4,6-dehydratase